PVALPGESGRAMLGVLASGGGRRLDEDADDGGARACARGHSGTGPGVEEAPSGFGDTISESLFGDVYDPSRWRPLSAGSFFTEGWNRPWASPPAGEGGAPRQGWLNAFDGVFYRLGVLTGGVATN